MPQQPYTEVRKALGFKYRLIPIRFFLYFGHKILHLGMAKTKKPKHIAVAGNIGAGKTTLTELLSKHYKWIPQFEDVDHNPYLNDFYEDMPRWSFNLQVFFLNRQTESVA